MKVFLICPRDEQFYNLLPEKLNKQMGDSPNVRVMGYPPLGIQTLAPFCVSTVTGSGCSTPATRK